MKKKRVQRKRMPANFVVGQLIHNNPVGASMPAFAKALIVAIRTEIARVYWNVNQKSWGFGGGEYGDEEWYWNTPDLPEGGTGIPGLAWRAYYNWGGSPEDEDWNQEAASLPNFSFEKVEIRWYKRFGCSMNANVRWTPAEWVAWFDRCMDALDVFENRGECHPRAEAIDNGSAARRCPKCARYYVQIHDKGRCGWDGTRLVAVKLSKEDRASIKKKRDEWRAKRKHGLPDGYEIVESIDLAGGWKAVLARHESPIAGMFGEKGPFPKDSFSAMRLFPCGCECGSLSMTEAECRAAMREYAEEKMSAADRLQLENGHEKGPF